MNWMFRRRIVIMNLQITHKRKQKITQVILSVAIGWLRANAVSK